MKISNYHLNEVRDIFFTAYTSVLYCVGYTFVITKSYLGYCLGMWIQ